MSDAAKQHIENNAAKQRIEQLTEELNRHCHAYYVLDAPVISDHEYDKLFYELREIEGIYPEYALPNSPTKRIGGVATTFAKIRHGRRMLSLENAYTPKEVIEWFGDHAEVTIHPKIDGASLKLIYKNGELVQAVTRGDGTHGEDVTANARTIMTVPLKLLEPVTTEIVGEVYMRYSIFNEHNTRLEVEGEDPFANPRNAAAGSLKLKNSTDVAARKLSFVAYGTSVDMPGITTQRELDEWLECLGFQSVFMLPATGDMEMLPRTTKLDSLNYLTALIAGLDTLREKLDLPTDGLVFKLNDMAAQRELGEGTRAPKWAVAYKYPPERKSTRLIGITLQVGKSGKLTPVAELAPVQLSGTTVSRASLCNADEIARLGVDVGDTVLVEKSAEIIPKVMGCAHPVEGKRAWQMPDNCPCCGTKLEKPEGFVDYFCPNRDCDEQVFARLKHALGKQSLDLDGCGEVMIRLLMNNGVRRLSDVFTFDRIREVAKASASKRFYEGRAKAKEAAFWRKLHALGIDGLGRTLCQDVANRFGSLAAIYDELDTFKELVGASVYANFIEQVDGDEIERLEQLGFIFHENKANAGPLSGKSFVITGTLSTGTRDEVSRLIEEAGGSVKNAVSKTTSYLIMGEAGGAQKRTRAEAYKVPIISEQELFKMMGKEIPKPRAAVDPDQEF